MTARLPTHTSPPMSIPPKTYPTSQFLAFDEAMETFLESNELKGVRPQAAALAVAGAVENNRCPMTNISWVIDGAELQKRFGFK
jgi:glucokinase